MRKSLVAVLLLVIGGVGGRLIPHPPNFTPVDAIAIFGGAWLRPLWLSWVVVIGVMGLSDMLLGWHKLWPFTWGAMLIGTVVGRYLLQSQKLPSVVGTALLQATLFFLITNLGVWGQGYYGYTISGLIACYLAAVPFYHYQVLGALTYSALFWGVERVVFPRLFPAIR